MVDFDSFEPTTEHPNPQPAATSLVYGWRGWLYLLINFFLGMMYAPLLLAGYAAAFALSFIWIGLPLLALLLSLTRRVAALDRWVVSRFLGVRLAIVEDDLNLHNHNPISMVGAHLTSGVTWQSAAYLFAKFPAGLVSFGMAMLVFPFLGLETILYLLGVNTGMFSGRVIRAIAVALSGVQGGLIAAATADEVRYVRVVTTHTHTMQTDRVYTAAAERANVQANARARETARENARQQKAKRRLATQPDEAFELFEDEAQHDGHYFVGDGDDGELQKCKR